MTKIFKFLDKKLLTIYRIPISLISIQYGIFFIVSCILLVVSLFEYNGYMSSEKILYSFYSGIFFLTSIVCVLQASLYEVIHMNEETNIYFFKHKSWLRMCGHLFLYIGISMDVNLFKYGAKTEFLVTFGYLVDLVILLFLLHILIRIIKTIYKI